MHTISYPHTKRKRKPPRERHASASGAIALGLVLLACLAACAFTLPVAARLVPPRYVARFVPEPLQGIFQTAHIELPTPMPASGPHALVSLLTPIPTLAPQAASTRAPTRAPQPSSSPTRRSAATPTLVPFLNATVAARHTPAALEFATEYLLGFRHMYQTWNNCGPANLSMALSYYGWPGSQADAAKSLKPDPEDRNVSPDELVSFARSQGFQALVRVNGTLEGIKSLIRAGIPPIVEKGFEPDDKLGWMGHYQLVVGWSDTTDEFIVMDSYLGPNQSVRLADMDRYWRQFNRTYLIIYKPDQQPTVARILGNTLDDTTMYRNALAQAQGELNANQKDAFGWFNLGSAYAALKLFPESAAAYDQARRIGLPWRMTWYQFGWFEAYLATNRLDDVMTLADVTLKNDPYAEEMYYYKGLVFQKRGDENAAREQFALALKHNPNYGKARQAYAPGP